MFSVPKVRTVEQFFQEKFPNSIKYTILGFKKNLLGKNELKIYKMRNEYLNSSNSSWFFSEKKEEKTSS